MTLTLNRQELDELKLRVDLLELFRSAGLEPKRRGKNWLCRCPFHDDATASLSIQPEKQLWNCFGCEAGGDALAFLQLKEKLEFADAVSRLRDLAGDRPPAHTGDAEAVQKLPGGFKRQELLARIADLYHKRFAENLEGQLGSPELWKAFQVGFATVLCCPLCPMTGPS